MAETKSKMTLSLDFRLVSLVLLIILAAMLAMWRPWANSVDSDRTIKVTGEATLKATPDEFIFYPSYEFKNDNREAAISELSKKSDEVVSKLKELGVEEKSIKTNSSNYDKYYFDRPEDDTPTYTLQITVTVPNLELAQTVQDYLVTTSPGGTISPQAQFSDTKQEELESQARDEATKAAKAKAEQSAKNVGANVGAVKSIEDGAGFGGVMPYDLMTAERSSSDGGLAVQPGENEISYSVTVTFFLK